MEEDLVDLAGAPGGFFAGLCTPHVGTGNFVVTSSDGAASWRKAGELPPLYSSGPLAATSSGTLAVSTPEVSPHGTFTARLFLSKDMGKQWKTALTDTQRVTVDVTLWVGFQTSLTGWWVGDPRAVWITMDGGEHWTKSPFP